MTVCPTQAIISAKETRRHALHLLPHHRAQKRASTKPLRPSDGQPNLRVRRLPTVLPVEPRGTPTTTEPDFAVRNGLDQPELLDLFALIGSCSFVRLIQGSAMGRVRLPAMATQHSHCTWAMVAGGKEVVEGALTDALGRKLIPMVDEHIRWALEQLQIQRMGTNERPD